MKLYTNKISTAASPKFDDFIAEFKSKRNIKMASVKTAEQEEADSSGQLAVEPLHQTGESTTMPGAGPSAKNKDDGNKSSAKVKTSEDDEAPDSGAGTGEAKLNNDPKVEKEEKAGSAEVAKVAEKDEDECGCGEDDCKKCTATMAAAIKTAGEKGMCSCGKPNFICKGKCKGGDCDGDDDGSTKEDCEKEDKESKADDKDKEEKEASAVKFVKIANLDEKNKSFLKDYWKQLFGDDYVSAIIADK
jgi:hypothetical protein